MPVGTLDNYPMSPFDWSPPWSDDGLNAAELVRDNGQFQQVTWAPQAYGQAINTYYALGGVYV